MSHQARKYILIILLLFFKSISLWADTVQSGHKISVNFRNCPDTLFYLNHYSDGNIITDDTAKLKAGFLLFEGSDKLEEGLYFISSEKNRKYFDFFITDQQDLEFSADRMDLLTSLKTAGLPGNKIYFEILSSLQASEVKRGFMKNDSVSVLLRQVGSIDSEVMKILAKDQSQLSLSEKYIKACLLPSEYLKIAGLEGHKANKVPLELYLDHFFDNLDFSDSRLINTPVFTQRLDEFIDTLTALPGMAMLAEMDRVLSLAAANTNTQEFVAWHLISYFGEHYYRPRYDEVYVHIMNGYLMPGKIKWYYPEVKERELRQLNIMEPLLTGKTGPNLEMPDTNGIFRQLYSVKAKYTLLLFWASTCSHCREEMPSIIKFYKEFHTKYELEVFAVSTDTSVSRWKRYIRRNKPEWINVLGRQNKLGSYHTLYNIQSTPVLYLLDDRKRIIAKYLTAEKLGEIIQKREVQ